MKKPAGTHCSDGQLLEFLEIGVLKWPDFEGSPPAYDVPPVEDVCHEAWLKYWVNCKYPGRTLPLPGTAEWFSWWAAGVLLQLTCVEIPSCLPDCEGKECGEDGCGAECAPGCTSPFGLCVSGRCVDLDTWLEQRPELADHLVWWIPSDMAADPLDDSAKGWVSFAGWPTSLKLQLLSEVEACLAHEVPDSYSPPLNILADYKVPANAYFRFATPYGQATELYVSIVAQSLALELRHQQGGFPPWSLLDLPEFERMWLLDGRFIFLVDGIHTLDDVTGQSLPHDQALLLAASDTAVELVDHIVTCPPGTNAPTLHDSLPIASVLPWSCRGIYQFLADENLLGSTEAETIELLLSWCRRLQHMASSWRPDSALTFSYEGPPPIPRVINGWVPEEGAPGPVPSHSNLCCPANPPHYTTGCQMTAELIRYILRAVNIPAYKAYRDSHAMAFFPTWGRVLLHADDPYKPFSGNVFTGFASCMSLPAVTYTMDTIQFLNMSVYIVEAGGYLLQGVNQQIYKWDRMVQYLIFEFSPYLLLLVCQDWKDSGDAFWPGGDPTVEMPKVEKFISDKLYQIGPETLDVVKNAAIFGPTGDQPYVVAAREKLDELIESEFPEVHECLELKGSVACLDDLIDWLFDLVYPEFGAEPCPSGNGHSFCTKELQICGGNCK